MNVFSLAAIAVEVEPFLAVGEPIGKTGWRPVTVKVTGEVVGEVREASRPGDAIATWLSRPSWRAPGERAKRFSTRREAMAWLF